MFTDIFTMISDYFYIFAEFNLITLDIDLPSKGELVCEATSVSRSDKFARIEVVVAFEKSNVVAFPEKVIHKPLPSSIWVPFSHRSYLNPSGRTT